MKNENERICVRAVAVRTGSTFRVMMVMIPYFPRHIGTKTAVSGISYEKIVQEKDPGNRENGVQVPGVWWEDAMPG